MVAKASVRKPAKKARSLNIATNRIANDDLLERSGEDRDDGGGRLLVDNGRGDVAPRRRVADRKWR